MLSRNKDDKKEEEYPKKRKKPWKNYYQKKSQKRINEDKRCCSSCLKNVHLVRPSFVEKHKKASNTFWKNKNKKMCSATVFKSIFEDVKFQVVFSNTTTLKNLLWKQSCKHTSPRYIKCYLVLIFLGLGIFYIVPMEINCNGGTWFAHWD